MNALKKIRDFFVCIRAYALSFIFPAAILFCAYILFKVYPFGENSVLSLDLNAQYVYYFDYMYDVFAGDESIFYCWSRNLSGEFAGIIGYYLASPFNFLVWIYPRTMITEGLMTMMIAKAAAAGLAMCVFLKVGRRYSDLTAVLFAVMYALCGYFVVQTMNPMWLDGLIGLPLVAMGVERVCSKRKFALYVLSLVYVFVTNFYIGYMIGIFSALYFLYFMLGGRHGNTRVRDNIMSVVTYGAASVAAILSSCFMILPVYKSLSLGKFEFTTPDYTPYENFNIGDIFIKLFPTSYDTVQMTGLPILYCGTLAIVCAAAYFLSGNFRARQRIAAGALIGFLVLSMYIRPVDMMWHGGQMPNWLPYRYSFMISFLLVSLGAEAFDGAKKLRGRTVGAAFAVLIGMLLFSDYNAGHEFFDTTLIIVIPILLLAVIAPLFYAYKRSEKKGARIALSVALGVVVLGETFLDTIFTLNDMDEDIVFSDRATYRADIPKTREITEQIHAMDPGFYRMEKTYHRCVNDPMALRMYGMSHSSSTLNAKPIALLKKLGFTSREHYTRSDGNTMLTDDIFGVKYILTIYSVYTPYVDNIPVESRNNAKVFENTDTLGIAYLADRGIIGFDLPYDVSQEYITPGEGDSSPFIMQNALAAALIGDDSLEVFKPIDGLIFKSENINIGVTVNDANYSYRKRDENEEAWIAYDAIMPAEGAAYIYLPTNYERETYLFCNDIYMSNYYKYENYSIEYLGSFSEGELFNVKLQLLEDAVYIKEPQIVYIDSAELSRWNEKLSAMNAETTVERSAGNKLTIKVNAEEDCALFTTIPLEEGWTAYIDGKEAPLKAAVDSTLLSLDVTAGAHTIVLEFYPAGLKTGLIFTASGVLLFAIMLMIALAVRIARKKAAKESKEAPNAAENAELAEVSDSSSGSAKPADNAPVIPESTANVSDAPVIPESGADSAGEAFGAYDGGEQPGIPENEPDNSAGDLFDRFDELTRQAGERSESDSSSGQSV